MLANPIHFISRRHLLAALLALCLAAQALAGCAAEPAPPPPQRVWGITVNETRLASLTGGDTRLVWGCTLELGLYKGEGATAAGEYTGQLMLSWEVDCYLDGMYTQNPPGLGAPPARRYALSAPLAVRVRAGAPAKGAAEEATAHRKKQLAALGLAGAGTDMTAEPQDDPATDGEAPAQPPPVLCDVDDFGAPLKPRADVKKAAWHAGPLELGWENAAAPPSWAGFCEVAGAMEAGLAGYEPAPPGNSAAAPGALTLWLELTEDGEALVWLPGFVPLEAGRPFVGEYQSGGSVAGWLPAPPGSETESPAENDPGAPPPDDSNAQAESQASNPFSAWLMPPAPAGDGSTGESGAGGSAADSGSLAESGPETPPGSEPESLPANSEQPDPLAAALAEFNLPPPPGEVTGPEYENSMHMYSISGLSYRDATAYARKLKMGGYRVVLSEVEQPVHDLYVLVAQSGTGRQLAFQYKRGAAELAVM